MRDGLSAKLAAFSVKKVAIWLNRCSLRSSDPKTGTLATIFGVVMLLVTASGVFGEMQSALNATWKTKAPDEPFFSMIRGRATSLGLVGALGFLLMVSLAASTGLSALGEYLGSKNLLAPLILSRPTRLFRSRCSRLCLLPFTRSCRIRLSRGGTSAPVRF